MGEKPFLKLFQTKGLGEGGERHIEEVQRILEGELLLFKMEDLGACPQLLLIFLVDSLTVKFVKITVKVIGLG